MIAREPAPDALIIGAPKAGTSALHAALAQHPQIYASPVKEPKYYMCWDAPPPAYSGPGDAHSNQEWVWRRENYRALFQKAPEDAVRLESTPFYLSTRGARHRIAEELVAAKLIVIVRDPIDRAYSNWMHLWVDGLEPISDFVDAWRAEDSRVAAGWAPFWHYQRLGRYGATRHTSLHEYAVGSRSRPFEDRRISRSAAPKGAHPAPPPSCRTPRAPPCRGRRPCRVRC